MANVLIEKQTMVDIANAIREESGTENAYLPAEMPQAIRNIQSIDTGVGSRQWWLDVCTNKTNFSYMFDNCSNITTIPQIDTSQGTDFQFMFKNCVKLTTIPQIDTSKTTSFSSMFFGCEALTTIPQLDLSNGANFGYMFFKCRALTTIPLIDTSKGTSFNQMFYGCTSLENISFVANCIKKSISFAQSPLLIDESIQSIIDGLVDLTGQTAQTITFHSDVKNKLTEEQIAQITSKNWTLA